MNEYEFRIRYYGVSGFLEEEPFTIEAENGDIAREKVENYAEVEADSNDFDRWEIDLIKETDNGTE